MSDCPKCGGAHGGTGCPFDKTATEHRLAEAQERLDAIARIPDVRDRAGVGDGSVYDAVVALTGALEVARRELAAAQKQCEQEAIHASLLFDENNDIKAKLARIEAAGLELPEDPIGCPTMSKRFIDYVSELRTFAIAQKVRADENERDARRWRFGELNGFPVKGQSGISGAPANWYYKGCAYGNPNEAIDAAIKEQT